MRMSSLVLLTSSASSARLPLMLLAFRVAIRRLLLRGREKLELAELSEERLLVLFLWLGLLTPLRRLVSGGMGVL